MDTKPSQETVYKLAWLSISDRGEMLVHSSVERFGTANIEIACLLTDQSIHNGGVLTGCKEVDHISLGKALEERPQTGEPSFSSTSQGIGSHSKGQSQKQGPERTERKTRSQTILNRA